MKVTIVTPSFNQGQFLEETIQSVLNQTYKNVELLVFDGGSSDNSLEILESYKDRLWYRSEKDNGQVNAINEGFERATGDVVTWLNSDDLLYDENSLANVVSMFENDSLIDAIFGDFAIIDAASRIIAKRKQVGFDKSCLLYGYCFIVPAIFLRKSVIGQIGALNTSFRYIFDWEYYLRLAKINRRVSQLNKYLFRHRYHKDSITVSTPEKLIQEVTRLRENYDHQFINNKVLNKLKRTLLEYYYRAKRWLLSVITRGNLTLPFSSIWIKLKLG